MDERGQILRTTDAGKSWKQVGARAAKVNVGGVFKSLTCALKQVTFVNATVAARPAAQWKAGPSS